MSRILIGWECGASLGHIALLNPIARRLRASGHELLLCYRSTEGAAMPWPSSRIITAPFYRFDLSYSERSPSFAMVLASVGLTDADNVFGLLKFWRDLYRYWQPDAVLLEYAPMAMAAVIDFPCKRFLTGWGFFVPPGNGRIPPYRHLGEALTSSATGVEDELMLALNTARQRLNLAPLAAFGEIYQRLDQVFLQTVPELDHYRRGDNARYIGAPVTAPGKPPDQDWPTGEGPRVLVYVKPFGGLRMLLKALRAMPFTVMLYAAEGAYATAKPFGSQNLLVYSEPLDIPALLPGADLVICHGGINLIQESLSQGVPLYVIPQHLEQSINAHNVVAMGAGLTFPLKNATGEQIAKDLMQLAQNETAKTSARAFANKYRSLYATDPSETVAQAIDNALGSIP